MMRFIRLTSAAIAFGVFASFGFAHVQKAGDYRERPGIMEFTGQMIVRPLQPAALAKLGKGEFEQFVVRARAGSRLEANTIEYVSATDEYVVDVPAGFNENTYSLYLMRTGDYQYAEPNWLCYPVVVPNDPRFSQQWHHTVVKSPQAWDLMTGNATIISAVVDTGIDLTHPDLSPNRIPGYNSVDRLAESAGGQVNDLNGHGTHVAGDAAAVGNNNVGVTGMGWNFRIMMVRTSNSAGGGASIADITDGARWAADNGAKAISASYSGVDAAAVGTTGTYIKTKGALFCYAAGNDNRNLNGFNHPDTIVVGASDQNDGKATFSAYGPGVHVFAPGVNIMSTTLGGGYGNSSGTSMAAPVCNGAIALIYSANPTLTANEVQEILEGQCDVIGSSTIFGHGRINQFKNMQRVFALNPIDSQPTGIQTVQGVHVAGDLSNILVPYNGGTTYDVAATKIEKLGFASGVEITYALNGINPTKLLNVAFTFQTRLSSTILVTGFVYAWNWNTGAFEAIGQGALSGSEWKTHKFTISSNPQRFVGPGGQLKTLFRAVGSRAGGRIAPIPFTLKLAHAKLSYAALP